MDLKSFRKAVKAGDKLIAKNKKDRKYRKIAVKYVINDEETKLDFYIKTLNCLEYEVFSNMQYEYDESTDKSVRVCSRYAASVVVGACDEDGNSLFDTDDIDFLECPENAKQTMNLCQEILLKSELTADAQDAKKPSL